MVCLGSLNDRVRHDKPFHTNSELIEFSRAEGFEVPEDYKYMPVTIDFLVNDNVKWHTPHLFEPEPYGWKLVEDHFIHEKTTKWANCKPLSYEAAKQRAEKKSSAGYIYKKKFRCNNKGEVFAKYDDHLKAQIVAISNGEDVPMVWEHGPKCEMRPLDKFENPDLSKRKQRTFMIADTLHYVIGLMLYSEQNDTELEDWDDPHSWSAAGMSLFHGGWDTMARLLLQGGSRFKCKDVSAMEASVRLPFQNVIYQARNYNYSIRNYDVGEEWEKNLNYHNLAKWWLKVLLFGPTVDVQGLVWMRFGMNPSGQLNTLLDNIYALMMVFLYCLTQQTVDPVLDIQDLKRVQGQVILKLMGDDSIYPENKLLEDLELYAAHIGFSMTDEIEGSVPLTEAKFCGFGWAYNFEHHQWQHRADYKKVLSRVYGYRKKNSWRYTLANLYASKMLLYGTPHYHTVVCLISYVLSHHAHDLASETHLESEIPYDALFTQDKSEDQIAQLIFEH